jgi:hypothetical protein
VRELIVLSAPAADGIEGPRKAYSLDQVEDVRPPGNAKACTAGWVSAAGRSF